MNDKVVFGSIRGFITATEGHDELEHIYTRNSLEAFDFDPIKNRLYNASDYLYSYDAKGNMFIDSTAVSKEVLGGVWSTDVLLKSDSTILLSGLGGLEVFDLNLNSISIYSSTDNTFPCNGAVTLAEDHLGQL